MSLETSETKKVRCRLTDGGAIGGWTAEILRGNSWVRVPNLVTDGNGSSMYASFDNRTQALKAAKKYARWLA